MENMIDFNKDIARDYGLRESVIATFFMGASGQGYGIHRAKRQGVDAHLTENDHRRAAVHECGYGPQITEEARRGKHHHERRVQ